MSYFDFYSKNIGHGTVTNKEVIVGTCYSMCPQVEICLREREKIVHVLEVMGPVRKLVKSYSRSAADLNMAVPHLLRPYPVLMDTLNHLLLEVTKRTDVPTSVMYDFISDRLRAIRQDMTIQRLQPKKCIQLLEPMIRFHVYFGYRLSNSPLSDFDPVLNNKCLLECMKWFLNCCDTMENSSNGEVDNLGDVLSQMDINKKVFPCDRALVESLYILCNLNDVHPLLRYLNLPKDLRSEPTTKLAYQIGLENFRDNYVQVCRLIDKLCPLTYCAIWSYLPALQRYAIKVMSHAYSSKQLTMPIEVIKNWLRFSTSGEVLSVCRHYGLDTPENRVKFNKADFKAEAILHQPQKESLSRETYNIEYIFTYSPK